MGFRKGVGEAGRSILNEEETRKLFLLVRPFRSLVLPRPVC